MVQTRRITGIWIAALIVIWAGSLLALAEGTATRVRVRAIARGAKVIGTGVGGARITIRDVGTGAVLAEGLQEGGTGDTEKIMHESDVGATYDTEGAAEFTAQLMLERPTVIEVRAEGPLGTPQSTQTASKTLLVVPGQDILGEGIVLEIYGLTVELVSPDSELTVGRSAEVKATVRMT